MAKNYLDLPGLTTYHQKIVELINASVTPILYDTTANWNKDPSLLSVRGCVYVYSDYSTDGDNHNIPGIKVGDGVNYLYDLPFTDTEYRLHINDTVSHITSAERTAWNNKERSYIDPLDSERLIFTTN